MRKRFNAEHSHWKYSKGLLHLLSRKAAVKSNLSIFSDTQLTVLSYL